MAQKTGNSEGPSKTRTMRRQAPEPYKTRHKRFATHISGAPKIKDSQARDSEVEEVFRRMQISPVFMGPRKKQRDIKGRWLRTLIIQNWNGKRPIFNKRASMTMGYCCNQAQEPNKKRRPPRTETTK